ncbi:MAG: NTP transferase domain-containing protein [Muribaculaceae bacterium]|nr:NTP transferase domain-containing protein [Muribaculaceae bacterium]
MELHVISSTSTIRDALERLNALSGGSMTLFVTLPDGGPMAGTVTDGDVRRSLLRGADLAAPVTEAMHREFRAFPPGVIDPEQLRSFRERGIALVPQLDDRGCIARIIDLTRLRSVLPLRAVLMAGGKGERLRPATLTTPKPLLKIDGKAIIDYNVELLASVGVTDITVATRYLSEKLVEHFAKPVAGVNVKCVIEQEPMGTVGAVALTGTPEHGDTIVMNSDLLTTVDFEEMYIRHRNQNADITVAAIPYTVSVPYAILTTDGSRVEGLEEKPTYSHFANAGIYIFSNSVLRTLPENGVTDATDLIQQTIERGGKVTYFPINGIWIDVGTPADFRHAEELMKHHRHLKLYNDNKN